MCRLGKTVKNQRMLIWDYNLSIYQTLWFQAKIRNRRKSGSKLLQSKSLPATSPNTDDEGFVDNCNGTTNGGGGGANGTPANGVYSRQSSELLEGKFLTHFTIYHSLTDHSYQTGSEWSKMTGLFFCTSNAICAFHISGKLSFCIFGTGFSEIFELSFAKFAKIALILAKV